MEVKVSTIYHNYEKIRIFKDNQIYWQFFLNFWFLVLLRQALYLKFLTYSKIGHGKVLKESQIKNVWKYIFIVFLFKETLSYITGLLGSNFHLYAIIILNYWYFQIVKYIDIFMKNLYFWSNLERNYVQNLEHIQKSGTVKF